MKKTVQRGGEGGVSGGICDSMDKLRNEYIRGTAQVLETKLEKQRQDGLDMCRDEIVDIIGQRMLNVAGKEKDKGRFSEKCHDRRHASTLLWCDR